MNNQKSTSTKVDELLQDDAGPEAILGEGLLKQFTKRLVEKGSSAIAATANS